MRRSISERLIVIRPETPADADAIDAILIDAFESDAEATLVRALRAEPAFDPALSLIAIEDDQPLGHILFTPAPIVDASNEHPALALAPMAVRADRQRRGIGTALVRAGLDACRARAHDIVHVLGHPAYYPRFGFRPAPAITCPFDPSGEAFMVLELRTGALANVRGNVRYLPPFTAF